MATTEDNVNRSAGPWIPLLLTLLLAVGAPALAQDQAAPEDSAADNSAQTPDASPVKRVFVRTAADAGALAQQYPHLALWLEPEDAPRVLALVEREATAKPAGAMVILANEGQSANDGLLEGLRARLTQAGWAAMTLGLEQPTPTLQLARERLADDGPPAEGDDAAETVMIDVNSQLARDLLDEHRRVINARLAAAVDWLTAQGYQSVVLVGVGRGADEVRAYLSEAPAAVKRAAWVAADFGGQSPQALSAGVQGATQVPILDLYPSRASGESRRPAAFRRAGVRGYEALAIPVPARPSARDAGAIANRLIGWAGSR